MEGVPFTHNRFNSLNCALLNMPLFVDCSHHASNIRGVHRQTRCESAFHHHDSGRISCYELIAVISGVNTSNGCYRCGGAVSFYWQMIRKNVTVDQCTMDLKKNTQKRSDSWIFFLAGLQNVTGIWGVKTYRKWKHPNWRVLYHTKWIKNCLMNPLCCSLFDQIQRCEDKQTKFGVVLRICIVKHFWKLWGSKVQNAMKIYNLHSINVWIKMRKFFSLGSTFRINYPHSMVWVPKAITFIQLWALSDVTICDEYDILLYY